jgi:hypothetical protein
VAECPVALAKRLYVSGPNATRERVEEILQSLWPGCRFVWVRAVRHHDVGSKFRVIGFFGPSNGSGRPPEPPGVVPPAQPPQLRRAVLEEKPIVRLEDTDIALVLMEADPNERIPGPA